MAAAELWDVRKRIVDENNITAPKVVEHCTEHIHILKQENGKVEVCSSHSSMNLIDIDAERFAVQLEVQSIWVYTMAQPLCQENIYPWKIRFVLKRKLICRLEDTSKEHVSLSKKDKICEGKQIMYVLFSSLITNKSSAAGKLVMLRAGCFTIQSGVWKYNRPRHFVFHINSIKNQEIGWKS